MQAAQICGVLEEHDEAYLETWQVPMLTWDELQELKQLYEAAPISALESPLGGEHYDFAEQRLIARTKAFMNAEGQLCKFGVLRSGVDSTSCLASVCSGACPAGKVPLSYCLSWEHDCMGHLLCQP